MKTKVLSHTESLCPVCLRVIEARRVTGAEGHIYLQKECPGHGAFSALIWEGDEKSYLEWGAGAGANPANRPAAAEPAAAGCPLDCGYCEAHESAGCCVLFELTARCNLRCPVCFASAGEGKKDEPTLAEIAELYDMLLKRGGPFNIQLSGGEPTLREDLPEIVALGRARGFSFFQLNTNGLRIAREPGYAEKLRKAGISCVFLQFDGLRETTYEGLRGAKLLADKLCAVENCAAAGLGLVLVPTLARGLNEDEMGAILDFALAKAPAVRGVHFQPMSRFGRCEAGGGAEDYLTIPRLLRDIEAQTQGRMRAAHFGGGGAENPYCSFHASYLRCAGGRLAALQKRGGCCANSPKSAEARDFVARQWRGAAETAAQGSADAPLTDTASLDAFLETARTNTFTVSGMLFQDAYTIDLERLRRCHIAEADLKRGMVPFCAYNLTNEAGKALYRP